MIKHWNRICKAFRARKEKARRRKIKIRCRENTAYMARHGLDDMRQAARN